MSAVTGFGLGGAPALANDEPWSMVMAEEEEEALGMFEACLRAEDECASLEARLMELRRRTV